MAINNNFSNNRQVSYCLTHKNLTTIDIPKDSLLHPQCESIKMISFIPCLQEQNYLDHNIDCNLDYHLDSNPEDASVYIGHLLFNLTKSIMIVFIVQSLCDGPDIAIHPASIWIKIIQIEIKIKCLHWTKLIDPDGDLDCNPDNFALCKLGITQKIPAVHQVTQLN